ncbi:hypothetical protein HOC35_04205 [Candidatus Woesearchaeota archaeon]|jgi:hypothetical protein|nr:hypothetical protein [Candidatus Woesearchaeota archaeon]
MIRNIKAGIKSKIDKWNLLKPIQKRFWKCFILIKIVVIIVVIGLGILFAIKFKQNIG